MLRAGAILLLLSVLPTGGTVQDKPAPETKGPQVTVPTFANATCPIMGKPAVKTAYAETDKGRIYMCCTNCLKKVKADPDKAYLAAYPTAKKADNKVCPISGEKIEKTGVTITLQGVEVGLCCKDCAEPAKASSQLTLVTVTNPKAVDIGNKTCPVTDKPVATDTFCMIDNDIVHLSSAKAVEEVTKDPAKYLAKAKEIKAKQDKEAKGSK